MQPVQAPHGLEVGGGDRPDPVRGRGSQVAPGRGAGAGVDLLERTGQGEPVPGGLADEPEAGVAGRRGMVEAADGQGQLRGEGVANERLPVGRAPAEGLGAVAEREAGQTVAARVADAHPRQPVEGPAVRSDEHAPLGDEVVRPADRGDPRRRGEEAGAGGRGELAQRGSERGSTATARDGGRRGRRHRAPSRPSSAGMVRRRIARSPRRLREET